MVITMHLRVGFISEAEEVILIWVFLLNLLRKKGNHGRLFFIFVTSFSSVYISLDKLFARQTLKN